MGDYGVGGRVTTRKARMSPFWVRPGLFLQCCATATAGAFSSLADGGGQEAETARFDRPCKARPEWARVASDGAGGIARRVSPLKATGTVSRTPGRNVARQATLAAVVGY